ncbi:MAG TPA: hypothetical protein VKV26_07150 [Dehalococcoidia bacterium]|nr:hypothetical protein [Dehalococcoidia bacterium]
MQVSGQRAAGAPPLVRFWRSRRAGRRAALLLAMLLATLPFAGRPDRLSAQGGAVALSPEEAVTRLAPYLLTRVDLAADYTPGSVSAATAVTFGFDRADPLSAFQQNTSAGLIVLLQQPLSAADLLAPLSPDALLLYLMRDADAAREFVRGAAYSPNSGGAGVDAVDLGLKLGDATMTWRGKMALGLFGRSAYYLVRWQQGRIGFEFDVSLDPTKITPEQVAALALQIGRRETAVPPPDFASPTVPPPASEAERAAALQQLVALDLPAGQAPAGYEPPDRGVTSVANLVARNLDTPDILQRVDGQWKRLIETNQSFDAATSPAQITIDTAYDADPASAIVDGQDIILAKGEAITYLDSPLMLGDFTLAFRTGYDSPSGRVTENLSLEWTHGPLLFGVNMSGPPGSTKLDDVLAFARAEEAQYQASPLAAQPPASAHAARPLAFAAGAGRSPAFP